MSILYITILAKDSEIGIGVMVNPENIMSLPECGKNNPIILVISLKGTELEGWKTDIERAVLASKKGYKIFIQFSGPGNGFSSKEELLNLASAIPIAVKQMGGTCRDFILGNINFPLEEGIWENEDSLSYAIKKLSVSCRSDISEARVYLAFIGSKDIEKAGKMISGGSLSAYIDGYLINPDEYGRFRDFSIKYHPASSIWVMEGESTGPVKSMELIYKGVAQNHQNVIVSTDNGGLSPIISLRNKLLPTAGIGRFGRIEPAVIDSDGKEVHGFSFTLISDIDNKRQSVIIIPPESPKPFFLVLPTSDIGDPVLYDFAGDAEYKLTWTPIEKEHNSYINVPGLKRPMVVEYKWLPPKMGGISEESVTEIYHIPVEVIMARVQAVDAGQREILKHYSANAMIEYHFRLPGGTGSVDVAFDDDFFCEGPTGAEWRQKQIYINGVAWKGRKIPELPVIEPEKVVTLPIDLTLNKDYSYRLLREEKIDNRDTWVIEFIPVREDKSLYIGKVWIDKNNFTRVKLSSRQINLNPPVTSNDETDFYKFMETGDGEGVSIINRIKGQQIFSIAGRQIFAERSIEFSNIKINDSNFDSIKKEAYASDNPMLKDTEKGLKYLKKDEEGVRKVQWEEDTKRKFWIFGGFYDQSLEFPLPFAGVNLLDYNWHKTKTQVNVFLAGAVNTISISNPSIFGNKKIDGRVEALLFAFPMRDRFYINGIPDESMDIKVLREFVNLAAGYKLGEFGKISLGMNLGYFRFTKDKDTSDTFILPVSHFDMGVFGELNYTKKGYSISGNLEKHYRSSWHPWGFYDSEEWNNPQKDYELFKINAGKTFYLPTFQKLGFSLAILGGSHLDRFSEYQFFYLGENSISGFSGSGVRFERGGIAKALYQFNIANIIRFGAKLDYGRVKSIRDGKWENHLGIGVDGSFLGPWETVISFDLGYSIASDIPAIKNKVNIAIIILKLF